MFCEVNLSFAVMRKSIVRNIIGPLAMIISSFTFLVDNLVRTEIYEGVSIDLPKSFRPMSEALLQEKYVAARRPLAAYTDPNQQVAFGLNVSNTRWQAEDLAMLKDFYRASLLELYDEVDMPQRVHRRNQRKSVCRLRISVHRPSR